MWSRLLRKAILADSSPRTEPGRGALELAAVDDPVREPVFDRLGGCEEAVALHVAVDLRDRTAGVMRIDLVDAPPQGEDLSGMDVDVGGLALEAAGGLVDEDLGAAEGHPLALRAAGEEQGAHRHRDAE